MPPNNNKEIKLAFFRFQKIPLKQFFPVFSLMFTLHCNSYIFGDFYLLCKTNEWSTSFIRMGREERQDERKNRKTKPNREKQKDKERVIKEVDNKRERKTERESETY